MKVASAARKRQSRPTSSMVPIRPRSCAASPSARAFSGSAALSADSFHRGVQTFPGETLLTRTPWAASSTASAFVNAVRAPFVAT